MAVQGFRSEFSVSMHDEACISRISKVLDAHLSIQSFSLDFASRTVTVIGSCSPTTIADGLAQDGRQVLARCITAASGTPDDAAVCVLRNAVVPSRLDSRTISGLARIMQVASTTILDLSVDLAADLKTRKLLPSYGVYLARTGDISDGAASTGGIAAHIGDLKPRKSGTLADLLVDLRKVGIDDMVGRALVIAPRVQDNGMTPDLRAGAFVGVVARSAGTWTGEKTVSTCSVNACTRMSFGPERRLSSA